MLARIRGVVEFAMRRVYLKFRALLLVVCFLVVSLVYVLPKYSAMPDNPYSWLKASEIAITECVQLYTKHTLLADAQHV